MPVGELLDVVDAHGRATTAGARRVVVRHPLQPFDPRNFAPRRARARRGRGASTASRSRARARSAGARARAARRSCAAPLPAAQPRPLVELDDLVRFVEHPVRAFLRQRLGISVGDFDDEVEDALPVELDALEQWGVGQRLLEARLARRGRRTRDRAPRSRAARSRRASSARPVIARDLAGRRARSPGRARR